MPDFKLKSSQDLTFNQYLALLTVADAFMVTSQREGMALRTHEYVICQEGIYHPLILSEVSGGMATIHHDAQPSP